jgi:hypothetical protein
MGKKKGSDLSFPFNIRIYRYAQSAAILKHYCRVKGFELSKARWAVVDKTRCLLYPIMGKTALDSSVDSLIAPRHTGGLSTSTWSK